MTQFANNGNMNFWFLMNDLLINIHYSVITLNELCIIFARFLNKIKKINPL